MLRGAWLGVVLVLCAGCGSTSHGSHARIALQVPGCTRATAQAKQLSGVTTGMVPVPEAPFGVATDGGWSFVTLGGFSGFCELGVFSDRGLAPHLVRTLPLPVLGAAGLTVTPDRRFLLVAAGSGAMVLSLARIEAGLPHALVGTLSAGGATGSRLASAIEVATSPDGRFAFVSLEYAGRIAVYDLRAAAKSGFHRSGLVGLIPVGQVNVGLAVSPDGRWLYATSEAGDFPVTPPHRGTLTVIGVPEAERNPARSVVATVRAGCDPVRVVASPDGSVVWVTARGSNALLGYAAAGLRNDRAHALLAVVQVGAEPVGMTLIDGGKRAILMDSDRFDLPGKQSGLAVVDTGRALQGKPALLGTIAAGAFPREAAAEPGEHVLLVSNFASGEVEAVKLGDLPWKSLASGAGG